MKEIVGAMIDKKIVTNNRKDILDAIGRGKSIQWFTRQEMQFMASCDLGHNWEVMANGPTLCYIYDTKNPDDVQVICDRYK